MKRLMIAAALAICLAAPAHAGFIQSQAPCTTCLIFDDSKPAGVMTASAFNFTAPTAGTATVNFNGSISCGAAEVGSGHPAAQLEGQIVTSATAIPSANKPGGLRLDYVFLPSIPIGHIGTLSLASTVTFKFAAPGAKTFYYRLQRLNVSGITSCHVWNAAFTVLFTP
jgi:hypothetical protein